MLNPIHTFLLISIIVPYLIQSKKRAILIGIDGLNPKFIQTASRSRSFNFLISEGSSTMEGRTVIQAMSAPSWGAIACALDPTDTGILGNEWLPPWIYGPTAITPIRGYENGFPCVFEVIKKQNPNLKTMFFYGWDWLQNLGNHVMRGEYIDDEFFCNGDSLSTAIFCDSQIVNKTIDIIWNSDFDFIFLHFNGLDDTGHSYGWGNEEYNEELGVIDLHLEKILKALKNKGIYNETFIVVTSDHGGEPDGHGNQNDDNILIPWIITGPGIKKGHKIKTNLHNMDTSPTLLRALNLKSHYLWRGKIVEEIFEESDYI